MTNIDTLYDESDEFLQPSYVNYSTVSHLASAIESPVDLIYFFTEVLEPSDVRVGGEELPEEILDAVETLLVATTKITTWLDI